MFPLKITVQSEFVILVFQSSVINSFFLDSIILRFAKLIQIAYQSPNSMEFE